jgi:hypothetical protein
MFSMGWACLVLWPIDEWIGFGGPYLPAILYLHYSVSTVDKEARCHECRCFLFLTEIKIPAHKQIL